MAERLPGKIFRILEAIEAGVLETALLFEAILAAGYGASLPKIQRTQERLRYRHKNDEHLAVEKQRFYNLLSKLKREGFVAKAVSGWRLTKTGGMKLNKLRQQRRSDYGYGILAQEKTVKIIAFDIPERERRKRHWLRLTLQAMGFTMLQRSVWVGTTVLPEAFFHDLRKARLIPFVQIFMISKTGSLKQIKD